MTEQLADRPIDRRTLANAIRALAMDAVEAAKSGHPGMPMGMADIAEVLWNDFLRFDPADPAWANRDRFVLSNGHGSMLQYALLHLSGYDLPIEELKRFRQWHSKTPGHPEVHETPGVETTTGPLGQGIANAVGMALAEKVLAARFNRDGHAIVDHMTYCFIGDGCLMEGISHEVASLAGTLKLGKLVVIWDDNGISIDGKVGGWFSDDTPKRFEAYGWEVLPEIDGHNPEAIKAALVSAALDPDRPTLICCRTTIGYGAPTKAGSESSHGAPLGATEIAGARAALGWAHGPFEIPAEVYAAWDAKPRGARWRAEWQTAFARYRAAYPELAIEFERVMDGQLPADYAAVAESLIQQFAADSTAWATRKASQLCLERLVPAIPELCGGSADLAHSNYSIVKASRDVRTAADGGNYVYFGVRDVRQIYVYTHDSIGLGEDGPTHQPVEHLASLRLIPNLDVWRPADGVETAVAWTEALASARTPSLLALSRQNLPAQPRDADQIAAIRRGGYVLKDCAGAPQLILIGTGSEVQLAMAAAAQLSAEGVAVRVVSMPSTTRFDAQPAEYRESVLPKAVRARVAVEAAHVDGWHRYVGLDGEIVGMRGFGASAPEKVCYQQFGITVDAVIAAARRVRAG
ncbi:MAG: transketolase [Xanthomonadales bacterium]|nr:transketolase [Xanthomonadales bacterium]